MKKEEENNDEPLKNMLDIMKVNNEFIIRQWGELVRQKNLWIVQIITIASAILGGFFLSRQQTNLVISFGVSLLFIEILIGLISIYKNNNSLEVWLSEASGKSSDYYMRYFIYLDLLKRQKLTEDEQKIKNEIESYFIHYFQEIGVIKENGTLGSIYDKLYKNRNIDWVNYLLIIVFFFSGLILTFSQYISSYLGWSR